MATPFLGIESNRAFASVAYIHTYIHTSIHKPLAYLGKYKYRLIAWNRYVPIRSVSIRFDPMRCDAMRTDSDFSWNFIWLCNMFVFICYWRWRCGQKSRCVDIQWMRGRQKGEVMLAIPIVLQYETKTKINKIKRTQN